MSSGGDETRGPVGRPAPQYGEYAPEGWAPPKPVPPAHPAPAAPAQPGQGARPDQPHRPEPGQGYIPYPPQPGYHPYTPQGQAQARGASDRLATIVLLVIGAAGAFIGVRTGLGLTDSMNQLYEQAGLGAYTPAPSVAIVSPLIWISHVVLYVVALGVSILLMRKGKRSFWVPLVAGVVAAIIFWAGLGTVLGEDPNLMQLYQGMGLG